MKKPIKEGWRTIPGFSRYEASDLGRIRRKSFVRWDGVRLPARVLNSGKGKGGKLDRSVPLGQGNYKPRAYWILLAFRGKPPTSKPLALHKDDDYTNNRLSNLYWGDYKENKRDAIKNGRCSSGTFWNWKGKEMPHKEKLREAVREANRKRIQSPEEKTKRAESIRDWYKRKREQSQLT